MNHFLEAALRYAEFGWHVFPCVPNQKVPITKHGVKDATRDADQIQAWWTQWPAANVAVACGAESGVYVIDVDVTAAGNVNGYESLKEFPELPDTVIQKTPRGGFHAFYRTDNPPANKNGFRPGIDLRGDGYYVVIAPSIHPNGGQYVWAPGCAPGEIAIAKYPDFIRPPARQPSTKPAAPLPLPVPTGDSAARMRVAEAYIPTCDIAVQGQAGHNKLFWAAQCAVNGIGLSDSEAYDVLTRLFNPFCQPPWDLSIPKDEKDFRRKISEAQRNPPGDLPHLWVLNNPDYEHLREDAPQEAYDWAEAMLANHLAGQQAVEQPLVITAPEFRLDNPPGLIGEICEWIDATSLIKQPLLTLACALTFGGALFGRKIKDTLGTRTNLYCMGVANSSSGKNHAPSQIRNLCTHSGCLDLLGGESTASDSAIEERVACSPSTLFLWDEIGFMLKDIKRGLSPHRAAIVSLLMRLYSLSGSVYTGREYAESDKRRKIIQPCCCLYGSSTPIRFAEGISVGELEDGWLARCLCFRASDDIPRKVRSTSDQPPPPGLCEKVAQWFARQPQATDGHTIGEFARFDPILASATDLPPTQIVVPRTGAAERLFIMLDDEAHSPEIQESRMGALWRKAEENARKVALIIAAGANYDAPEITEAVAEYACQLIRHLLLQFTERTAPEIVDNQIEFDKQKIFRIIARHGTRGCVHRTITKQTQRMNRKGRDALIADMIEAERILREPEGRTFRYWSAEHSPWTQKP